MWFASLPARVVELVDTQVSEACAERCNGSSPFPGTIFLSCDLSRSKKSEGWPNQDNCQRHFQQAQPLGGQTAGLFLRVSADPDQLTRFNPQGIEPILAEHRVGLLGMEGGAVTFGQGFRGL